STTTQVTARMGSPSTSTMASVRRRTMSCFCSTEKTPSITFTLTNGMTDSFFRCRRTHLATRLAAMKKGGRRDGECDIGRSAQMCKDPAMAKSVRSPHRVAVLALPNTVAFDLAIPAQIFGHRDERDRYRLTVCGVQAGSVPTTTGF